MEKKKNIKIIFVLDEDEAAGLKKKLQEEKLALGVAGRLGRRVGSLLDKTTSLVSEFISDLPDFCDSPEPEGENKSKRDSAEQTNDGSAEKTNDGSAEHANKSWEDLFAQEHERREDMCSRHLAALEAGEDITMEHPSEDGFFVIAELAELLSGGR